MKALKNKSRKSGKYTLVVSGVFLLFAIGIPALLYFNKGGLFSDSKSGNHVEGTIDLSKPTRDQIEAGKEAKTKTVDSSSGDQEKLPSKQNPADQTTVSVTLTSSNISNQKYSVRSFIDKITSSGECTLTMSNGHTSDKIVMTSGVQPLPNGSTCRGFDVSLSNLTASNKWIVKISFSSGSMFGETNTEVTL